MACRQNDAATMTLRPEMCNSLGQRACHQWSLALPSVRVPPSTTLPFAWNRLPAFIRQTRTCWNRPESKSYGAHRCTSIVYCRACWCGYRGHNLLEPSYATSKDRERKQECVPGLAILNSRVRSCEIQDGYHPHKTECNKTETNEIPLKTQQNPRKHFKISKTLVYLFPH